MSQADKPLFENLEDVKTQIKRQFGKDIQNHRKARNDPDCDIVNNKGQTLLAEAILFFADEIGRSRVQK